MIVQVDVVGGLGPPTVLAYHPPRIQVMLHTLYNHKPMHGSMEIERWLLHLDGRVFYKHVSDQKGP